LTENYSGNLSLVGTPIGNLEDITLRAIKTIKESDFILAEDTRRTITLLNGLDMGKKEIISFSQQKMLSKTEGILTRIKNGEKAVLVTDAGMPVVSDPGSYIVQRCHEEGIEIDVIPGPSAPICAYAASGFNGSFIFEGFLGRDKKLRRYLRTITEERRMVIFFESPFRLLKTLADILDILGNREVFIAREMTKIHQEFFRGTVQEAIEHFSSSEVKGEITVVLKGVEKDG